MIKNIKWLDIRVEVENMPPQVQKQPDYFSLLNSFLQNPQVGSIKSMLQAVGVDQKTQKVFMDLLKQVVTRSKEIQGVMQSQTYKEAALLAGYLNMKGIRAEPVISGPNIYIKLTDSSGDHYLARWYKKGKLEQRFLTTQEISSRGLDRAYKPYDLMSWNITSKSNEMLAEIDAMMGEVGRVKPAWYNWASNKQAYSTCLDTIGTALRYARSEFKNAMDEAQNRNFPAAIAALNRAQRHMQSLTDAISNLRQYVNVTNEIAGDFNKFATEMIVLGVAAGGLALSLTAAWGAAAGLAGTSLIPTGFSIAGGGGAAALGLQGIEVSNVLLAKFGILMMAGGLGGIGASQVSGLRMNPSGGSSMGSGGGYRPPEEPAELVKQFQEFQRTVLNPAAEQLASKADAQGLGQLAKLIRAGIVSSE